MTATSLRDPIEVTLVSRLSRIEAPAPTVVSCYLRLDVAARRNRAYLVVLLNRIRDLEMTFEARGLSTKQIGQIKSDLERIVRWLAVPANLPKLPGIALFASSPHRLFETIPLARVHRNRLDVDTGPLLHELIDAQETLGHYLAVAIDRHRARFFHVTAANIQELTSLTPRGPRHKAGSALQETLVDRGPENHRRLGAERHRHYASVAREIERLLAARPYRGIALLGAAVQTTALAEFLPPRINELIVGRARLAPGSATPAEVSRIVWGLEWQRERHDEADLLDRIEAGLRTGWATNGVQATLQALAQGQIKEMAVRDDATGRGFRCGPSGRLTLSAEDCRGPGLPTPVANLVDHAIEEALRQQVAVVVIDDAKLGARVDGLAATLRFRST